MKKLVSLIGIVAIMLLSMLTAYAGDVPEALSYEEDAKIFIGIRVHWYKIHGKPKATRKDA